MRLLPWFDSPLSKPKDWQVGVLDLVYAGWIVAPGSVTPDHPSWWLPMLDGVVTASRERLVPDIVEWARRVSGGLVELAGPNLLEALRGAAAPTRAECELPDDRTDAENAALRDFGLGVIERGAHELKGRVKGDGRSLIALKACASAAPLVWAGLLDEKWVRDRIDAVQPGLETQDNCVRNGLDKGNTLARAELSKIRQRGEMAAAVLAGGGAAGEWGNIKTQGFGPAAVAPADGTLDASPLPEFKSCPAVAEVVEKGETFGVDPAGAAGVAVCMACNLAAVKFDVCVKKKAVGPHLHMMFVQESGSGKSTMFKALTKRPLDILRHKSVKLQDAADEFTNGYAAFKESVKKSSKGATKVTTGAVLSPKRVFTADTTPQTLASDLSVTQPATIMVTDEASQLYDAASLEHAKPLASLIINTADGAMVERSRMSERKTEGVTAREANRVTGNVEANRTCRFSAIMATQPGTWQSITKGPHGKHFDGRGAPARQLLIAPATDAKLSARASLERADRDGVDAFPLATEALCEMAADFDLMIGRTSPYAQEYWKAQAEEPAEDTARSYVEKRRAAKAVVASVPTGGVPFPWAAAAISGALRGPAWFGGGPDTGSSVGAPTLPDGVMLGGDTMHRLELRLSEETEGAVWRHDGRFLEEVERGLYGTPTEALRAVARRLTEKVFKVAAGLHALNERKALADLQWTEASRNSPVLVIPEPVVNEAWDFVMRCFVGALNENLYSHRARGRETLAEAKDREFNSPTAASEMEGRAAEARAVLLRKLAGAPEGMTARQAHAKLSKRQLALFPQGVATALATLVAEGTATSDKEGDGAIFKASQ